MVHTCFACKWRSDKLPSRSFHRFPTDEESIKKWLTILNKDNVSIGKNLRLCSLHFEDDCFQYGLVNGRKILKRGSFPSLRETINTKCPVVQLDPAPYLDNNEIQEVPTEIHEVPLNNHSINTSFNKSVCEYQKNTILNLKKKVYNLQRTIKSLRSSKIKMKDKMKVMRQKINNLERENSLWYKRMFLKRPVRLIKLSPIPKTLYENLKSSKSSQRGIPCQYPVMKEDNSNTDTR